MHAQKFLLSVAYMIRKFRSSYMLIKAGIQHQRKRRMIGNEKTRRGAQLRVRAQNLQRGRLGLNPSSSLTHKLT